MSGARRSRRSWPCIPGYAPSDELAKELLAFIKPSLAGCQDAAQRRLRRGYSAPVAGKVQRRQVRAPYWAGRAKQI